MLHTFAYNLQIAATSSLSFNRYIDDDDDDDDKFEEILVLTVMNIKMTTVWNVTQCSLVDKYRHSNLNTQQALIEIYNFVVLTQPLRPTT